MKTANLREGRAYDGNDPPGPETPPTMPQGTVRVDVSDVYDWYKLGQHISNMKGLGRHDFGAGPPSSIISFGDEETEHKYIQDLENQIKINCVNEDHEINSTFLIQLDDDTLVDLDNNNFVLQLKPLKNC